MKLEEAMQLKTDTEIAEAMKNNPELKLSTELWKKMTILTAQRENELRMTIFGDSSGWESGLIDYSSKR